MDLAQAAIGPGMAVYTRYAKVLDAEGKPLSVREALALINQTLDEALAEQEGDFDADSRWALAWFEQSGFAEGEYGVAETLSKAKNTSVAGMVEAGILRIEAAARCACSSPSELPADWDPATDKRLTAWEMVHHLIRALEAGGEAAAAALVAKLGSQGRDRPRAGLPALHALRAQEARGRGAVLQRPRAELAGDHPAGPRRRQAASPARRDCSSEDGHVELTIRDRGVSMAITNHERVGKALELLQRRAAALRRARAASASTASTGSPT